MTQQPQRTDGTSQSFRELAFQDELTGLGNRRQLKDRLTQALAEAQSAGTSLGLLMIDIDRFKLLNDAYGHVAGDKVIQHVGLLLQKSMAGRGMVFRYAGDEFTVLLPNASPEQTAESANLALKEMANKAFRLAKGGKPEKVTLSIGGAVVPENGQDPIRLIESADRALYRSKREGRNRTSFAWAEGDDSLLHIERLQKIGHLLVGRDREVLAIEDALRQPQESMPRALLFFGGAGMGKSALLEEGVLRSKELGFLAGLMRGDPATRHAAYAGLRSLFSVLPYQTLTSMEEEIALLKDSFQGPLRAWMTMKSPEDPSRATGEGDRRLLFDSLVALSIALTRHHPLCIALDNMDDIDEGSLQVCHALMSSQSPVSILFIMAGPDPAEFKPSPCLATLLADERIVERMNRYILNPLTLKDVVALLDPLGISAEESEKVGALLLRTGKGIPAVTQQLVKEWFAREDRSAVETQWAGGETETSTLTRFVLESLDPETKTVVLKAAAVGESITPSDLESLDLARNEGHALDLLEGARKADLIRENDAAGSDLSFRFATRQTQETAYGEMAPQLRDETHQTLGKKWQSEEKDDASLWRSAYHFDRANDVQTAEGLREKARGFTNQFFVSGEALRYLKPEEPRQDPPIPDKDLPLLSEIIRTLRVAVQNIRLFPPNSQMVDDPVATLMEHCTHLFEDLPSLSFSVVDRGLLVNGRELPEKRNITEIGIDLSILLAHHKMKSLTLKRGVSAVELKALVEALATKGGEFTQEGAFSKKLQDVGVYHVVADERVYVTATASEIQALQESRKPPLPAPVVVEQEAATKLEQPPIEEPCAPDWREVLGRLLRGESAGDLSSCLSEMLQNQEEALNEVMKRQPAPEADPKDWVTFLQAGQPLVHAGMLKSEDLLRGVAPEQASALIDALSDSPELGVFLSILKSLAPAPPPAAPEETTQPFIPEPPEPGPDLKTDKAQPVQEQESPRRRDQKDFETVLRLLAKEMSAPSTALEASRKMRESILEMAASPRPGWILSLNPIPAELVSQIRSFNEEEDIQALSDLGTELAFRFIQAGDIDRALYILNGISDAASATANPRSPKGASIRHSLRELGRSRLLPMAMAEMASNVPERVLTAATLLSALGQESLDHLATFVATTAEERARTVAAEVLAGMGKQGTRRYLEELSTAVTVESKKNLLSVIHLFKEGDIWDRMEGLLAVEDPSLVRLLIHALSRSNADNAIPLLLNLLQREDLATRREAVVALGKIGAERCVEPLCHLLTDRGLLGKALEDSLAREVCIALGRIRNPKAAEVLIEVMKGTNRGPLRRGWAETVRAAAAWALGQIDNPECHRALQEAASHGKGPVRTVARMALQHDSGDMPNSV